MNIQYAILGLLSQGPLSGYDLKKIIADSDLLYWSGNNNQIYRTLVKLHESELVEREVQYQEDKPPRKIYTLTDKGAQKLHEWSLTSPQLPQLRHPFMIQLSWANQLNQGDLDRLLESYEEEVQTQLQMKAERKNRDEAPSKRPSREAQLHKAIQEYGIMFYENELAWVRELRKAISPS